MIFLGTTKLFVTEGRAGEQRVRKEPASIFFIPVSLWTLGLTTVCVLMLVGSGFRLPWLATPAEELLEKVALGAGGESHAAAVCWIEQSGEPTHAGNTEVAEALAKEFSVSMQRAREGGIALEDESGGGATSSEFRCYCFLGEGRCAFVVTVPDVGRFDPMAARVIYDDAWWLVGSLGNELSPKPERVAVGVRGALGYTAIIDGPLEGKRPISSKDEALLYPFFSGAPAEDTIWQSGGAPVVAKSEPEAPDRPRLPSGLRIWTASDGRPMDAKLVGFSLEEPRRAMFERVDGKPFTIAIDQFTPEDQITIRSYLPRQEVVDYRVYRGLMGEGYAGNVFIIRYGERLVACMSRHQFDNDGVPSRAEDIDTPTVLLDTTKVLKQDDVQILPLVDQKQPVPYLAFAADYVLEEGEQLWIERGPDLTPSGGTLGQLRAAGLKNGKYVPREGARELVMELASAADVRGASGCPVYQVSTGKPVGVLLAVDEGEEATEIVFEPICLPPL
jgi:hypothetical protein